MSRFAATSALFAAVALAAGVGLHGPALRWGEAALGAGYLAVMAAGVSCLRLRYFGPATVRGRTGERRVALTFDDGPDPATTGAVLSALVELDVKAAFFCIGTKVRDHGDLARRIVAEGHEIGNHSFRHAWWGNFLFGRGLRRQIVRAQDAIERATGIRPRYYRPPMGLSNPHLPKALSEENLTLVGWDVGGFDRGARNSRAVACRILRKARDGSIVLLHDGGARKEDVLEIVRLVVHGLRAKGLALAPLHSLLDDEER